MFVFPPWKLQNVVLSLEISTKTYLISDGTPLARYDVYTKVNWISDVFFFLYEDKYVAETSFIHEPKTLSKWENWCTQTEFCKKKIINIPEFKSNLFRFRFNVR